MSAYVPSHAQASSFKFDSGLFKSFRNDRDKLQFICAGTAAGSLHLSLFIFLLTSPHVPLRLIIPPGMASAFGAPISGVLLVLEEGASFWDTDLILFSFFCGLSAKFFFFIFLQVRTRTRTRTTVPPYTHGD
jgi:chloride channel 7